VHGAPVSPAQILAPRDAVRDISGGKQMKVTKKQDGPEEEVSLGKREFYTVSQLADLLQLTEMTIYRMVNRGELPCYAIGRIKRFRQRDIEEFLESHRSPTAAHERRETRARARAAQPK
jgi:excisionase family DNA binding protein